MRRITRVCAVQQTAMCYFKAAIKRSRQAGNSGSATRGMKITAENGFSRKFKEMLTYSRTEEGKESLMKVLRGTNSTDDIERKVRDRMDEGWRQECPRTGRSLNKSSYIKDPPLNFP